MPQFSSHVHIDLLKVISLTITFGCDYTFQPVADRVISVFLSCQHYQFKDF